MIITFPPDLGALILKREGRRGAVMCIMYALYLRAPLGVSTEGDWEGGPKRGLKYVL